jgi:hypothetical protein
LSGTDSTVPIRHESKDIGLDPPKIIVNAAMAQSGPREEVPGSSDLPGGRSASPDPSGTGLASPDPPRDDSASLDPCRLDRHERTPPNTKREAAMLPAACDRDRTSL